MKYQQHKTWEVTMTKLLMWPEKTWARSGCSLTTNWPSTHSAIAIFCMTSEPQKECWCWRQMLAVLLSAKWEISQEWGRCGIIAMELQTCCPHVANRKWMGLRLIIPVESKQMASETRHQGCWTVGAIALGPSGNLQGGIWLFSLATGEMLAQQQADCKRMMFPEDAIMRIYLATKKNRSGLSITNQNDEVVEEAEEKQDHMTDDNFQFRSGWWQIGQGGFRVVEGRCRERRQRSRWQEWRRRATSHWREWSTPARQRRRSQERCGVRLRRQRGREGEKEREQKWKHHQKWWNCEKHTVRWLHAMTSKAPSEQHQNGICTMTQHKCQNLVLGLEMINGIKPHPSNVAAIVFSQMSVNQGLQHHGERGKASAMKEIKNLVSRKCFGEVKCNSLSEEDKQPHFWHQCSCFWSAMETSRLEDTQMGEGRGHGQTSTVRHLQHQQWSWSSAFQHCVGQRRGTRQCFICWHSSCRQRWTKRHICVSKAWQRHCLWNQTQNNGTDIWELKSASLWSAWDAARPFAALWLLQHLPVKSQQVAQKNGVSAWTHVTRVCVEQGGRGQTTDCCLSHQWQNGESQESSCGHWFLEEAVREVLKDRSIDDCKGNWHQNLMKNILSSQTITRPRVCTKGFIVKNMIRTIINMNQSKESQMRW